MTAAMLKVKEKDFKMPPPGFEPGISCLLDRRLNQLGHGGQRGYEIKLYVHTPFLISAMAWTRCEIKHYCQYI